ncbi:MAG: cysteine desulfurase [Ruminococcus sp.]|nr:cysteine desulfurase [Ruminococcus sp.]
MIYLDNSATTVPEKAVADKIYEMLTEKFGNPSSFHRAGLDAYAEVKTARAAIAKALSCEEEEIVFTSGGTEANNLAVFGAAEALKRRGNRIVTTEIEHESVLEAVNELEMQGFEVIRLAPDKEGNITPTQLEEAINEKTILVSVMYVNNEVGSILPVTAIQKAVKKAGAPALIHLDCVQAFGKLPVKPKKLGADLVTVTAHKIHGPKGTGALYIRKGVRIVPRQHGGAQERKIRPGTEAAPLIAAFGAATAIACEREGLNARYERIRQLRDYAVDRLRQLDGIVINSPENALPYIVNFSTCRVKAETMLNYLSERGIYVSGGSACAKGEPSHVIKALRLPRDAADSAIRVSFCGSSTAEEVDALIHAVSDGLGRLAHFN